jgi:hypothetical protein
MQKRHNFFPTLSKAAMWLVVNCFVRCLESCWGEMNQQSVTPLHLSRVTVKTHSVMPMWFWCWIASCSSLILCELSGSCLLDPVWPISCMSSVAAFIPSVTQLTKDKRIEKVVWWKSKWLLLDSHHGQQMSAPLKSETVPHWKTHLDPQILL